MVLITVGSWWIWSVVVGGALVGVEVYCLQFGTYWSWLLTWMPDGVGCWMDWMLSWMFVLMGNLQLWGLPF